MQRRVFQLCRNGVADRVRFFRRALHQARTCRHGAENGLGNARNVVRVQHPRRAADLSAKWTDAGAMHWRKVGVEVLHQAQWYFDENTLSTGGAGRVAQPLHYKGTLYKINRGRLIATVHCDWTRRRMSTLSLFECFNSQLVAFKSLRF